MNEWLSRCDDEAIRSHPINHGGQGEEIKIIAMYSDYCTHLKNLEITDILHVFYFNRSPTM